MSAEMWFVQRCLEMPVGNSEPYPPMGLTVHRYKTSWFVLWDNPTRLCPLGRECFSSLELRAFLAGNTMAGIAITPETHCIPVTL